MDAVRDVRSKVKRKQMWAHARVEINGENGARPGRATRVLRAITGRGKKKAELPGENSSAEKEGGFGGKNIGLIGGFMLITNNVTGPGLIALSTTFQQGGFVFTTTMLLFIMMVSYLASTFMCEAMSRVPGNCNFEGRVEFTYLCKKTLSKPWYLAMLLMFMFSLQATNVLSIVESSQTLDETFVYFFGASFGLQIYAQGCSGVGGHNGCLRFRKVDSTVPSDCPFDICTPCEPAAGYCLHAVPITHLEVCREPSGSCKPRSYAQLVQNGGAAAVVPATPCAMLVSGNETCSISTESANGQCPVNSETTCANSWTISLGFLVLIPITIPLGYLNLDDNIIVQKAAFWGLIAICVEWTVQFFVSSFTHGCHDFAWEKVPAGASNGWQAVIGTVLYNYAFVTTVPSWVNEKEPGVSVNFTLWWGTVLGTIMFLTIGYFGGISYSFSGIGGNSEDLLSKFNSDHNKVIGLTLYSVYIYPIIALMTSIPIFSIIIRYNILENKLCGKGMANFWAVVAPWMVAVFFYTGDYLSQLLLWTGLIITAPINFMLPAWLYIRLRKQGRAAFNEEDEGDLNKSLLDGEDGGDAQSKQSKLDNINNDDEYERKEQGAYSALPEWVGPRASLRIAWAVFISVGVINVAVIVLQFL